MVENFYQPKNPWIFVIEREIGTYPNVSRNFTPMNCMHCENPPCKNTCDNIQVNAITKNEYGIVLVDAEKCIGCKYCIAVCPYGAMQYISELKTLYPEDSTPYENINPENKHSVHRKKNKTVEKCTLCWHRIEKAIEDGKRPGDDQESTPACVINCPVKARIFGDLDDPNSEISKLISKKRATKLKREYGTNPQVYHVLEGGEY
jgi:Fe-S-cluster-containing dehydrogenase component